MIKNIQKTIQDSSDYLRGQAEAAKYLRVSRRCVSEWQSRKIISFLKVSRKVVLFRKTTLDAEISRFQIDSIR